MGISCKLFASLSTVRHFLAEVAPIAATGGHFVYAGAHIVLPDASRLARELGTVKFGVQPAGPPYAAELADSAGASACLGNRVYLEP